MTDEEIAELIKVYSTEGLNDFDFARAIEAKVREECAVICENRINGSSLIADTEAAGCAETIRARGKK